jgi:uncharacterized OB-fold protein
MEHTSFSDISFEAFLTEEKLMGSRCLSCGSVSAPPRALCAGCYSTDMAWQEMKGTGKLLAFTCIYVGAGFMLKEGFNRQNPYCVGVVELEEGCKVNARLVGVEVRNPESIQIGTPLRVVFVHAGEGESRASHLAFTPA